MAFLKKSLFILFIFNIILLNNEISGQEVPQSVDNKGVYDFLDELANIQIISINSAVKPYSRLFIFQRLKEVEEKQDQLNPRQRKELEFYMLDFGKEEETAQGRNGTKAQGEEKTGRSKQREDSVSAEGGDGEKGGKPQLDSEEEICSIIKIICFR